MKEKSLILAVETSSRIGSVAIALNGKILGETVFSVPLRHSIEIFPAIRELLDQFNLKPGQIEHIYISGGPGSFTGLRIATTLAKIMQLAHAAKIVTVDTLDVVAANVINLIPENTFSASNHKLPAMDGGRVAAVLDAKRGQFFIAGYERDINQERKAAGRTIWKKVLPDCLMTISQFLDRFACEAKPIWLLGDGLLYYKDKFQAGGVHFFDEKYWSPRAGKVHLLGRQMALKEQFTEAVKLSPNYLRKPDVTVKPR
ncbi:MAG TPA: tRNA (adenosine(37)-N6)-threonylcarbamoyltransferase complex dimerization subunit type 1 TsaB [Sedimentisphaerales bacterium]|nr:tRNA (adenosine(37)-N6)-threonylcarbamoyltransferase complex dimerization subunit type 1 TsaB [Sedimentisphaerales bacterium]